MNQIDRLKALRDEARARIDAAKKALEEGADGRMVASLDELIAELETHPDPHPPAAVVPLTTTALTPAPLLEEVSEFETPIVEEVSLETNQELEIEDPTPIEEPAPIAVEPEPTPIAVEPEPAPVAVEPEPAPIAVEPAPILEEPITTPEPVPIAAESASVVWEEPVIPAISLE